MANRLTPRHRKFLNAIDAGQTPGEAYRHIGGKGNDANKLASQMLALPQVREEYERRQAKAAEQAALSRETILNRWEEAYAFAKEAKDTNNVVRILEQEGKITGLYVDKTEDVSKSKGITPDDASKLVATIVAALMPVLAKYRVPETEAALALQGAFAPQAGAERSGTSRVQ